jgi:Arc/MetJ-type ribon-helix-helix transcriptional regulator
MNTGLVLAPFAIHIPSTEMVKMEHMTSLRAPQPDSEKLTINLGYVDLGRIELLVQEGFYANRSDFIRSAIRRQLDHHGDVVAGTMERQTLALGLRDFSREELEALRAAGETLHVRVVGLVRIAQDVSPELASATIASITVLGGLQASPEVKKILADRIR